MGRYVVLRLGLAALLVFCLVSLVFVISRILGDPVALIAPLTASKAFVDDLRQQLGFADPLGEQYLRFLRDAIHGDFGISSWQRVPALPLVLSRLPATWQLAGTTMVIALVVGIGLGMLAARRQGSTVDSLVTGLSMASASMPGFWLALVLILVFAVQLRLLPTSGYGNWQNFILPLATLVPLAAGRLAQITRSSMIDVLNQGYIKTAHAKGLAEPRILIVHALQNAAIPILTVGADELATLLNGSVIVETIFGWPGIGFLTTQAITNRDLSVITAAVLVVGVQLVLVNLLIDLLYTRIDPRIRFA
jgi:peptide/nickel transport system permease protein